MCKFFCIFASIMAKSLIHNKRRNQIRLHSEGKETLIIATIVVAIVAYVCLQAVGQTWWTWLITGVVAVVYVILLNFFRCPIRMFQGATTNTIVAPADGRIVVIEEVDEEDYFHDRRKMVSIFMSLTNVHANWVPCDGEIIKVEHQDGNYMKAYLPKASTENERSMVVIRTPRGQEVMVRQVAGALARRIVTYVEEGSTCYIDDHLGFIKFGSRVDLYLPLDADIQVTMGQATTGDETIIAKLK